MTEDRASELRAAIRRVQDEPTQVADEARAVLVAFGHGALDLELEALAHWAIGLAAREQGDLDAADAHLELAAHAARRAELDQLLAEVEASKALVLALRGRIDKAIALVRAAEARLSGAELAIAVKQRGLIYQRSGDLREAVAAYSEALPIFRSAGDDLGETRLRVNRALARAYLGHFDEAESDLRCARDLSISLDQALLTVFCEHNLGFVHGRRGAATIALHQMQRAYNVAIDMGVDASVVPVILVDRAEVLASIGMTTDALADASEARTRLAATENVVELAETELLVARIALTAGNRALAHEAAVSAEAAFAAQGREPWRVLASAIAFRSLDEVQSQTSASPFHAKPLGSDRAALAREGAALADALVDAGWDADARTLATLAGRLWRVAGDDARAVEQLGPVAAGRRRGSAIQRVQAWQAEALIRIIGDDRAGARRAIRAGLDTIAAYRTTMAATDLRATVSSIGDELASWLTELALDRARPRDVLAAAETWRAGSLVAPVVAPDDDELERLLGELRAADADRRAGTPGAEARRARLETAVRDRARQLPGTAAGPTATFDARRLADTLDDRVLIEFVDHDGTLHAVTMHRRRARLHHLGALADVAAEISSMRSALQRLARAAGSERSLDAARDTLAHAAATLDEMLLAPLADDDVPAVIVPTGVLHGVAWAALDRLRHRPFAVAPSARAWLAAATRAPRTGHTVIAAGPDLVAGGAEVDAVAAAHPGATVLSGDDATVDAVLAALDGAAVAHVAAHGDFRLDNPQLCSLRFADGDLRVYDLERLPAVPPVVVLSACDAATVAVKAGDELLGLSAAVLRLGASSMVAPMVPVDDHATADLMGPLHRELAAGASVPDALYRARSATADDGGRTGAKALAAAVSFVVLGS